MASTNTKPVEWKHLTLHPKFRTVAIVHEVPVEQLSEFLVPGINYCNNPDGSPLISRNHNGLEYIRVDNDVLNSHRIVCKGRSTLKAENLRKQFDLESQGKLSAQIQEVLNSTTETSEEVEVEAVDKAANM